jgi:hypothetical protein
MRSLVSAMATCAAVCGVAAAQSGLVISPPEAQVTTPPPPATKPATPAKDSGPLLSFRPNQEYTVDAFIGSVNAEPIFATELFQAPDVDERLKRLAQVSRTLPEFQRGARDIIRRRVEQLYSEALVLSAADASLTADERARIDDLINGERMKLITKYGGSAAAADKALRAENPPTTLAQEVANRKKQFKKDLYFSRHIAANIQITQDMARAAYEATPDKWKQKAQIQIYTITIPVSRWLRETLPNGEAGPVINNASPEQVRAAEAEAMKTAREIVQKLNAKADFARLAEEYHSADVYAGDGGKWKPLVKGSMRDTKWEDYLFSLPAKSLQEPYMDRKADYKESAVLVIRTGDKLEARTVPFVEVQGQIVQELRAKQIEEMRMKKMNELAAGAAVEAIDRMMEVAVNAAVSRYATK